MSEVSGPDISSIEITCSAVSGQFGVEKVGLASLQEGKLDATWSLSAQHPSFSGGGAEELAAVLKVVLVSTLLSTAKGAWDVSDEWNKLLPDYRFAEIEDFLAMAWNEKE